MAEKPLILPNVLIVLTPSRQLHQLFQFLVAELTQPLFAGIYRHISQFLLIADHVVDLFF